MLTQSKQKTILWVSKEAPPQMTGAHYEAYSSGKEAVNKWRSSTPYVIVMVDTGVLSDGLTGFDVTRNIRAASPKAPIYMMLATLNGPESVLAQRMRVNGILRRGFNDVQKTLREANAINWADRPGIPTTYAANSSLSQRIMSIFKVTEKAPSSPNASAVAAQNDPKAMAKHAAATTSLEDVLSDLSSLDFSEPDTNKMTTDDFIATAGLTLVDTKRDFPVRSNMNYELKNPHDIKLLNFIKLGEDYQELDRQFAWELYTELSTRVAVTGKANDATCVNTEGELWYESFSSLLAFCKELRVLLRSYPAQHSKGTPHLGNLLVEITRVVLNPFLDKWRVDYLHWWEYASDKEKPPIQRQQEYPKREDMLVGWRELKMTMRAVQETILKRYKL